MSGDERCPYGDDEKIRTRLLILEERFVEYVENTKEFREVLTDKMDAFQVSLNNVSQRMYVLPCAVHDERLKGHERHITALWGFLGSLVLSIIVYVFKRGL